MITSINHKVWDEITHPFPNLNGYTVEVWEWISKFTALTLLTVWLLVHAGIKVNPYKHLYKRLRESLNWHNSPSDGRKDGLLHWELQNWRDKWMCIYRHSHCDLLFGERGCQLWIKRYCVIRYHRGMSKLLIIAHHGAGARITYTICVNYWPLGNEAVVLKI